MIERCEFDTIYHEHLCYFSLTALDRLATRQGLVLRHVERIAIHGGSLRCFVCHGPAAKNPDVVALLRAEAAWGADRPEPYERFATSVQVVTEGLVELLRRLKHEGKRIAAYGAAAKGRLRC